MLVVSRKASESVVVGCTNGVERLVKITVIEIQGESARLGFEVRDDFPVYRWEVWERIRAGGALQVD